MALSFSAFEQWKKREEERKRLATLAQKTQAGFIGPLRRPSVTTAGPQPSLRVRPPSPKPEIKLAPPRTQPKIQPVSMRPSATIEPFRVRQDKQVRVVSPRPKPKSAFERAEEIAKFTNTPTSELLKKRYGDNFLTKVGGLAFDMVDPVAKTLSTTRISNRIAGDVASGKIDPQVFSMMSDLNKSNLQVLGDAIQVGTLFAPVGFTRGFATSSSRAILKKYGLKTGLKELAKIGVKEGAAQGLAFGVGEALSSGSKDLGEISKIIATNAAFGAVGQGIATPMFPLAGRGLRMARQPVVKTLAKVVSSVNKIHDDQIAALVREGVSPKVAKMLVKEGGFLRIQPPKVKALQQQWEAIGVMMERTSNKTKIKTMQKARKKIEKIMDEELRKFYEGGYVKFGKDLSNKIDDQGKPERGFLKSVKESPNVSSKVKKAVSELPDEDRFYDVAKDKDAVKRAQSLVKKDESAAVRKVFSSKAPDKDTISTGIELMRVYRKSGNTSGAVDVADELSKKLTQSGQTIQAASLLDNLSPDGVLVYAQRQISKNNKKKIFPQYRKKEVLNQDTAKKLQELAQKAEDATDPKVKGELRREVRAMLNMLSRSGVGKKVAMVQTIAQLLNPKTMTRNIVGNEIFWRLERINKYVATPIDFARSKLTGSNRTVTFRTGQVQHWDDYFKGLYKGIESGFAGTSRLATRSDFKPGLVFTSKWNPLKYFEKTMKAGLQGFDQAAFNRGRNAAIGEMAYLKALNEGLKGKARKKAAKEIAEAITDPTNIRKPVNKSNVKMKTDFLGRETVERVSVDKLKKNARFIDNNILEIADEYGLYITYQDNNLISKGLTKVKRGLNIGKDFGFGDIVIKYPKTPGAILARGLEYGPAGFLKAAYQLAAPWIRGGKPNAKEVTEAVSRAITGTVGLTGMGYALSDLGIITGKSNDDFDIVAAEQYTGVRKYQVNLSALKRFVLSGFDKKEAARQDGDRLYSYDWAQPVAMMLSIGANMNTNVKENKNLASDTVGTITESFAGGVETLTEQPVLTGLSRLIGNPSGATGIAKDTVKSTPSSFAPTAGSQVNQFIDNQARSSYDPSIAKEAWNRVKGKIPGLAQTLPSRKDIFGDDQERFQNGSNNLFNVFINPGFISQYQEDPNIKMVMDIYSATGETKQAPRIVPASQTISKDGESTTVRITSEQRNALQTVIGKITKQAFERVANNPKFTELNPEDQAKELGNILSDINQAAKIEIIDHTPSSGSISGRAKSYIKDMKNDPELRELLFTPSKIGQQQ